METAKVSLVNKTRGRLWSEGFRDRWSSFLLHTSAEIGILGSAQDSGHWNLHFLIRYQCSRYLFRHRQSVYSTIWLLWTWHCYYWSLWVPYLVELEQPFERLTCHPKISVLFNIDVLNITLLHGSLEYRILWSFNSFSKVDLLPKVLILRKATQIPLDFQTLPVFGESEASSKTSLSLKWLIPPPAS